MPDPEHSMLAYAQLADVSRRRRQQAGQDRFLILAGIAALRAGWPDVAERCREIVVAHEPRHLLAGYATFGEALRDPDFQPFVRRMERFCPFEQAEALLAGVGLLAEADPGDLTAGELAMRLIADADGPPL